MKRRSFVTASGAAIAGSVLLPQSTRAAAAAPSGMNFNLPDLPYAPEALEPHIDTLTMTIHHGRHHLAYVTNLKKALEDGGIKQDDPVALLANIPLLPDNVKTSVRNNGGGHVNHSWFWEWMAAPGDRPLAPEGKLAEGLQTTFGSIDDFKKAFAEAAAKRFGSGWVWLIRQRDTGKLLITSTPNQDNPLMTGIVPDGELGQPLLGLDVWEHAYYLKFQNKRPDYVTAWWNVVNWQAVSAAY